MRRVMAAALLAGGCAAEDARIASFAEGEQSALVFQGAAIRAIARGEVVSFDLAEGPPTILFYASPLEALALHRDAEGALVTAKPADDPELRWPLPASIRGVELGDELRELSASARAAIEGAIEVPASCGRLELVSSLSFPEVGVELFGSIASSGDLAFATTTSREALPRLFAIEAGVSREIALPGTRALGTNLRVFSEGPEFLLVETQPQAWIAHRLTRDGELSVTASVATTTAAFGAVARYPGTLTVVGRRSDRVLSLDLRGGSWVERDRQLRVERRPICDALVEQQALFLEGETEGVVGYEAIGLVRFSARGREPILDADKLGRPCSTRYLAFASGAELAPFVAEDNTRSAYWRPTRASDWARVDLPFNPAEVIPFGDRAIVRDPTVDDVMLMAFEPRRPERRPRICAQLGVRRLRWMSFDGSIGFGTINPLEGIPRIVSFRVVDDAP